MNHDELMQRLERERVSYPDDVAGERYAPGPAERVAGRLPAYTPITEQRAAHNRARLAETLGVTQKEDDE
jgi:hypothetical protein